MSFIKSLAVTAFACAAFMASSTASADVVTAGSAPAVRFTNYNICGNVCGGTAFDNQRRIDMVVNETAPEIWGADQLFLTEVCKYQYDAIDARLKPRGFTGNFAATLSGSASLCKGTDYGIAVFVKGIVLDSTVLDLKQGTESEGIKAPCLKHQLQGRPTWACSAHLYWASNTLRDKEALALAAQAKAWEDAGTPVVLGGDFNATPAEMSYFYSPVTAGYGRFTEVDETDVDFFTQACLDSGVTHCRSGETSKQGHEGKPGFYKIDYILTTGHFTNHKGDVLPLDTKVSDHQMQRGAASWAGCGPAASGLFRRDAAGDVYRHPGTATGVPAAPCKVALGLGGLRLIARDGNELVGIDGNGDLWNYAADASTGTYRNGVKLGSGWQAQNVLLAPGDFSGDAIPDLITRDSNGDLWLSKGNLNGTYDARTRIGYGWQIYSVLLAPGDFSGDGKPDLIGRDSVGDLWLYNGNGAGSYAPRVKIGYSWNFFVALAAPGDFNGDGKADLIGRTASGSLWFYAGTGTGAYQPGISVGSGYAANEVLF